MQLKQRNDFLTNIKGQLESRARQDLERRDRERRELLALVHEQVLKRIQTPQVQSQILAQCLKDLQKLAK